MVHKLDIEAGRGAEIGPLPAWVWVASAAAACVLAFIAFLTGLAFLLLLNCVLAGAALTHLIGLDLELEERLAYGTVLGAMAVCLVTFGLASVIGMSGAVVLVGNLAVVAAAGWVTVAHRGAIRRDLDAARARWSRPVRSPGHPWPLAALFTVCGAYWIAFMVRAYSDRPSGLFAGYVNIWGDWAAHLVYASSFAYGQNFPPQLPIDPGHHLGYPFMLDFLAATLAVTGTPLTQTLTLTSGLLGLAFPPVMYLAARRFTGSRLAAVLAVAVFLCSGGLGFVQLFQDVQRQGLGILAALPREYTLNRDQYNIQWLNPVLAYLVPQRTTLFGFALALMLPALLFVAARGREWRPFLFVGLVTGFTPWFHVYAYGTVLALGGFWFLYHRRREWLAFLVPALVLGVPAVLWLLPPTHIPIRWQLGWMADMNGHHDNPVWFWLLNLGLFVPALIAAQVWLKAAPRDFASHFLPMWLWFIVPNLVLLTPWEWDNTKFFIFWALLGAVMVGSLLAELFRRGGAATAAAAVLLAALTLTGAADLWRATNTDLNSYLFADHGGLRVAAWVRDNTPPHAMFLVATEHNEPVLDFSGRPVVLGFPGWVFSYGLDDWYQKKLDATTMLQGGAETPGLVKQYGVAYVVIGPQELTGYQASLSYWQAHASRVYADGAYSVFKIVGA